MKPVQEFVQGHRRYSDRAGLHTQAVCFAPYHSALTACARLCMEVPDLLEMFICL